MMRFLDGVLCGIDEESILVDVHGVGIEMVVSSRHLEQLRGQLGQRLRVWVVTRISDDTIHCYGFANDEERALFLLLSKITGVGAKASLSLLGAFGVAGVVSHIEKANEAMLCSVPLIGKRIAARLCLELKGRLNSYRHDEAAATGDNRDAVMALVQWGYAMTEAENAVQEAMKGGHQETAHIIADALKRLSS